MKTINTDNKDERQSTIDRWIDKQDVMSRLHISARTLQNWRTKGIIPYCRIGKKIFYRESDLDRLFTRSMRNLREDSIIS